MAVITKKVQSPVAQTDKTELQLLKEAVSALIEKVEKIAGGYDSGYGAPGDNKPSGPASKDLPGTPGVKESPKSETPPDAPEKKDGYGEGYHEPSTPSDPKAEDEEDDKEMEECTCDKCGSKYKAKKAEKKDDEEDDDEEEEEEEDAMPKKASGLDFGKVMKVFTPSTEDLVQAKTALSHKNEIFGVEKKNTSIGRQMTEWAMAETSRLTPSK